MPDRDPSEDYRPENRNEEISYKTTAPKYDGVLESQMRWKTAPDFSRNFLERGLSLRPPKIPREKISYHIIRDDDDDDVNVG